MSFHFLCVKYVDWLFIFITNFYREYVGFSSKGNVIFILVFKQKTFHID